MRMNLPHDALLECDAISSDIYHGLSNIFYLQSHVSVVFAVQSNKGFYLIENF
jgi:hypothetical protein